MELLVYVVSEILVCLADEIKVEELPYTIFQEQSCPALQNCQPRYHVYGLSLSSWPCSGCCCSAFGKMHGYRCVAATEKSFCL